MKMYLIKIRISIGKAEGLYCNSGLNFCFLFSYF